MYLCHILAKLLNPEGKYACFQMTRVQSVATHGAQTKWRKTHYDVTQPL